MASPTVITVLSLLWPELTFSDVDHMAVPQTGQDLDLPPDSGQVSIVHNLRLLDVFDRHLLHNHYSQTNHKQHYHDKDIHSKSFHERMSNRRRNGQGQEERDKSVGQRNGRPFPNLTKRSRIFPFWPEELGQLAKPWPRTTRPNEQSRFSLDNSCRRWEVISGLGEPPHQSAIRRALGLSPLNNGANGR
ncbi:hypothetical protein RRG08_049156 [Elysia crispata]|uniref:Uncharacterized protein n=1 Tax=Elysia crispata TaxID=231223 RepID=A0AAE1AR24_9GAST|nr:hypothetical protein RRG08_049156 [Elysia crispata]